MGPSQKQGGLSPYSPLHFNHWKYRASQLGGLGSAVSSPSAEGSAPAAEACLAIPQNEKISPLAEIGGSLPPFPLRSRPCWGGNWRPIFSLKNWRPFLVINRLSAVSSAVSPLFIFSWKTDDLFCHHCRFYSFHLGVTPLEGITPHLFYLFDLVYPLFFVNSATTKFLKVFILSQIPLKTIFEFLSFFSFFCIKIKKT